MLLFFTGSDWCGWCIRLQKEVFATPEFVKWANDNVILVELDFPKQKMLSPDLQNQNAQLQQVFQVQGYPTVFIANAVINGGKVSFQSLGKTGYLAGGPIPWLESANTILKNK